MQVLKFGGTSVGKPERLKSESVEDVDDYFDKKLGQTAQTHWEAFGTESNAMKAREDVGEIAELIYKEANFDHAGIRGPFAFGGQTHSATLAKP